MLKAGEIETLKQFATQNLYPHSTILYLIYEPWVLLKRPNTLNENCQTKHLNSDSIYLNHRLSGLQLSCKMTTH